MKILVKLLIITFIFSFYPQVMANYGKEIIKKIMISKSDIPNGFMYGKVPDFANKIFKNNPWLLDQKAIKTLADDIYPGGDYKKILDIHVTIMSKKDSPYGDDIVCYIILYRDQTSAKSEIRKLTEFAGFNDDRVIVLSKDNMAIYLHVDDVSNFHLIKKMSKKIKKNLVKI